MTQRIVLEEGGKSKLIELAERARVTAGRAQTNLIVVDDGAASREHCAFEKRGAEWWVVDLDSKNGTRLNGKPIKVARMNPGDRVEIGLAKITLLDEDLTTSSEDSSSSSSSNLSSSGLSRFAKTLGTPSTQEKAAIPAKRAPVEEAAAAIFVALGDGQALTDILDAIEKEVLARALGDAKGNRSEVARKLKLSRPGLLKKMKRYGLK